MKKLYTLTTLILFHFSGISQFNFYVFPTAVLLDHYADTVQNTRNILLKAGVKQIKAYQLFPEITRTFANKTVNINKDGRIDNISICFRPDKNNFTFCSNDTLSYDKSGRLVKVRFIDTVHKAYYAQFLEQITEGVIKHTYITISQNYSDTSVDHKYYNRSGQLVRLEQKRKNQPDATTSYYYNKDGLLDSLHQTFRGTFIFNRSKKGKNKIIKMENIDAKYKWVYNNSGQCIMTTVFQKNRRAAISGSGFETNIYYYYNTDGTLSKVIHKSYELQPITMYYSYTK